MSELGLRNLHGMLAHAEGGGMLSSLPMLCANLTCSPQPPILPPIATEHYMDRSTYVFSHGPSLLAVLTAGAPPGSTASPAERYPEGQKHRRRLAMTAGHCVHCPGWPST